jgi:N6-adenosine-specific RNA methylase IME4
MAKKLTIAKIVARLAKPKIDKATRRVEREKELAAMARAIPGGNYAVLYADPPWQFEVRSEKGQDRSASNHYPTMGTLDICDLKPPGAPNSVLFLWATVPMLPDALVVMKSWGYAYKSHVTWVKDKVGTGYWFRNQHELLLVGTRGDPPAPTPPWPSVIHAPRALHSAKPEAFYVMIETYFPSAPKLELFARGNRREGWSAWGNQAT